MNYDDEYFMRAALKQAHSAYEKNEVPVGAIVVHDNHIIASAHNMPVATNDPAAHAEILAIREACRIMGNYRLVGATLYATLEPCLMCCGAIVHARIARVVFGACDEKYGAAVSIYRIFDDERLNHRVEFHGGVLKDSCAEILRRFFREKRLISPTVLADL